MSGKNKLILSLLGATALFAMNTSWTSTTIRAGEKLPFDQIALGDGTRAGLDSLTRTNAPATAVLPDMAVTPQSLDVASGQPVLPAIAPAEVRAAYQPGDNPFVAAVPQQVQPRISPLPQVVSADPQIVGTVPTRVVPGDQTQQALPAKAATFNLAPVTVTSPVEAKASPERKVDETALRYYASKNDLKRLGAEMRRLKALYPDWQAPQDLFAAPSGIDEQPLWDLYATGNYAAVRAHIAYLQSNNPQWQPSEDLTNKLQMGEARSLIRKAASQLRWGEVLSTAQSTPKLLTCTEMQALWDVGEAFARTRDFARSFDLYKYILTNCQEADLRLATVQKASLLLPPQGVGSLIALGRLMPDGSSEFENVGYDGLRQRISVFTQNKNPLNANIPAEDLQRFADFIQRTSSQSDAGLLGWYFYAQEDWKAANAWFITAAQYERTPKNIEGVILSLRMLNQPEDALTLARLYQTKSPEITQQYIEIIASSLTAEEPEVELADKELEKFENVVAAKKSPLGAQALGWHYLDDGDKTKASTWFADSVKWEPTEGGVLGLAVLAARAKNYGALSSLKSKYREDFSALDDFKIYKKRSYRSNKKSYRARKNTRKNRGKTAETKKRFFLFQKGG